MRTNPTNNSNYLLNENIVFGWYPATNHDSNDPMSNSIQELLLSGRDTFVNLVTEQEKNSLPDYARVACDYRNDLIFINYPIRDCECPQNLDSFRQLIEHLKNLYLLKRKLYIHCRGGHGRSGVVSACLLIHLGFSNEKALEMISQSHKTRHYIPDYPCPQTSEQCEFVRKYTI